MTRNKAVIEETYRLLGKPVPASLREEMNPDSQPEDDEEGMESDDYEENEAEDDNPEVVFGDGTYGFVPELQKVADAIAMFNHEDAVKVTMPNIVPPHSKLAAELHVKAHHLRVIQSFDTAIAAAIDLISKRVQLGKALPLLSGVYVHGSRGIGLVLKSTAINGQYPPPAPENKASNVLLMLARNEQCIVSLNGGLVGGPQLLSLASDCQHLLNPIVDEIEDWANADENNTERRFSDPRPKYLAVQEHNNGKWSATKYDDEEDVVNSITPIFLWTDPQWRYTKVMRFQTEWEDHHINISEA